MTERSIAEFLADLDRQAAQDDEDEQTLLSAGVIGVAGATGAVAAKAAKAIVGAARTVIESAPAQASAPSPKFCRQCGVELKPEWRFCTKCGATISRT